MSTLLVNQLVTGSTLEQTFRLKEDRTNLASIAPYLYLHNSPSGNFTFSIIGKDDRLMFFTTFNSEDIKRSMLTANNYIHVFFPLYPMLGESLVLASGVYKARLSASQYDFSDASFIGWVIQNEEMNNPPEYEAEYSDQLPMAMRLKIYKQGFMHD